MLTPMDDFPIHQTSAPVAQKASSDPNHYDRYFFNGYTEDTYLGVAMAHYPNRGIADAAISVVHDGVQRSLFVSGPMPADPAETTVGPVAIEITEPLRVSRVVADVADHGVAVDMTFTARTAALEEPRQVLTSGHRITLDNTRLTQWGSWRGTVRFGDVELDLDAMAPLGVKDRSWGVRPVGDQPTSAPSQQPRQFFFVWAPLHFAERCTHYMAFDGPRGERHIEGAALLDVIGSSDPTWGPDAAIHLAHGDFDVAWEPGLRRARAAEVRLRPLGGRVETIELEPLLTFRMRGLGYGHPVHRHGTWLGDDVVAVEQHRCEELDSLDPSCIHVQQVVRATDEHGEVGIGALELFAVGPHEPTGLTGLLDGYAPTR